MKNITKISISLFLITISTSLFAQKEWSLEDCIKYALDKNIQIKRQELTTKISSETYSQSKVQMLPNLYANLNHQIASGKALNYSTYQWIDQKLQQGSVNVESDLTLFNGFQQQNTIRQNEFNLLKSLKDLDVVKNNVTVNVAAAYLQILLNEELLEGNINNLKIAQLQVDKTEKLVNAGSKAKGDLFDMLSQAATEKVNVTNAENNLKISYLTLSQLLELDSVGNFRIQRSVNFAIENMNSLPTVDSVFFDAKMTMPEIKSAEYNLNSFEKGVSIARGQLSPQFSLSGILYTRYDNQSLNSLNDFSYTSQAKNNLYKQLSINLYIPLFNRMLTQRNISIAKTNKIDAEYNLELAKKTLYKQIQQAHADATAALATYNSTTESVVSNEEAFKYAQQKYDVGILSSFDYNIAKNKLILAKSQQLSAKYDYIFKSKILDFYSGKSILL